MSAWGGDRNRIRWRYQNYRYNVWQSLIFAWCHPRHQYDAPGPGTVCRRPQAIPIKLQNRHRHGDSGARGYDKNQSCAHGLYRFGCDARRIFQAAGFDKMLMAQVAITKVQAQQGLLRHKIRAGPDCPGVPFQRNIERPAFPYRYPTGSPRFILPSTHRPYRRASE